MRLSTLLSTVIVVASVTPLSRAAAADAPSWPPGTCVYRDLHYTNGTVICVAPHFGQTCNKDGVWDPPTNAAPLPNVAPLQDVCASAQVPTNPAPSTPPPPAVACTYHSIQYSDGSTICVAPSRAQTCKKGLDGKDGSWDPEVTNDECAKAQIPAPTGPPAPAGK